MVDTTFRSHGDVGWGESSPQALTLHFDAQIYWDGHTSILQHGRKQTPVVSTLSARIALIFCLYNIGLLFLSSGLKCWAFPAVVIRKNNRGYRLVLTWRCKKNPELWLNLVIIFQFSVRTSLKLSWLTEGDYLRSCSSCYEHKGTHRINPPFGAVRHARGGTCLPNQSFNRDKRVTLTIPKDNVPQVLKHDMIDEWNKINRFHFAVPYRRGSLRGDHREALNNSNKPLPDTSKTNEWGLNLWLNIVFIESWKNSKHWNLTCSTCCPSGSYVFSSAAALLLHVSAINRIYMFLHMFLPVYFELHRILSSEVLLLLCETR